VRKPIENLKVGIWGVKFYDANVNGIRDPDEVLIPGWRVEKTPPTPNEVTYTGADGMYGFLVDQNSGVFTILEVLPSPSSWKATTPTSGTVTVYTTDVHGPDFGNVCLGVGGGLTLGYWSNKNGQTELANKLSMAENMNFLCGLNLRNADGTDFNPSTYTQFRTWLISGNAVNMAYMLSVQLATMELNVKLNKVKSDAIVYVPELNDGVHVQGFVTVQYLMNAANAALLADGLTLAGDPNRVYQETLKNALDNANNNKIFVQPTPCTFTTPY